MADGVRIERDTARRMGRATLRMEALTQGVTHGPRRARRPRRHTTGGTTILSGQLIADLPAGSKVDDCIQIYDWNGEEDINWYFPYQIGGEDYVIGGANRTTQSLRGSVAKPTAVWGKLRTGYETVGETVVEKHWLEVMFLPYSGTPNHETTPANGEPQAITHAVGSDDYTADGGPCAGT